MIEAVKILAVHRDAVSGTTVVLLGESAATTRVLPIFVGPAEAQAIVIGLRGLVLPRPGTHDVMVDLLERLSARLTSVVVTELKDATFYAELQIEAPNNSIRLSVRPSDGMALATRLGTPVFVESTVFEAASVEVVRAPGEPLAEEEIENVVSEFQEFLASTEPQDFATSKVDPELPAEADEDDPSQPTEPDANDGPEPSES